VIDLDNSESSSYEDFYSSDIQNNILDQNESEIQKNKNEAIVTDN